MAENVQQPLADAIDKKLDELYEMDVNNFDGIAEENEGDQVDVNEEGANDAAVNGENDEENIFGYESDSGNEEDATVFNESELIRGVTSAITLQQLRRTKQMYCVNVSYVLIELVNEDERKLCHSCYVHYQSRMIIGRHKHVTSHYKTKLHHTKFRQYCYLCNVPLYQLCIGEICSLCHNHTTWV